MSSTKTDYIVTMDPLDDVQSGVLTTSDSGISEVCSVVSQY